MKPKIKTGYIFLVLLMVIALNACSTRINEVSTEPEGPPSKEQPSAVPEGTIIETGVASWYGKDYHGKRTSNGEIYDMNKMTAAHKTLPFHTRLWVENTENNKKVMVRINDRGPFIKDRIIDLSRSAAKVLGIYDTGTTTVRLIAIYVPPEPGYLPSAVSSAVTGNSPPEIKKDKSPVRVIPQTPVPVPTPQTTKTNPKPGTIPPPQEKKTEDKAIEKDIEKKNEMIETNEGGYYLQAGAFSSQKNAERVLKKIKDSMPDVASSFKIENVKGLYKILTVKWDSRDKAEKIKKRLEMISIDSIIKEE